MSQLCLLQGVCAWTGACHPVEISKPCHVLDVETSTGIVVCGRSELKVHSFTVEQPVYLIFCKRVCKGNLHRMRAAMPPFWTRRLSANVYG